MAIPIEAAFVESEEKRGKRLRGRWKRKCWCLLACDGRLETGNGRVAGGEVKWHLYGSSGVCCGLDPGASREQAR